MTKNDPKPPVFPQSVVAPVSDFLSRELKNLVQRKKVIQKDDPFHDLDSVSDNSAPDADAEQIFGHARSTAIQREVSRRIIQTKRALTRIKVGKYGICTNCGNMIDTDRLMVYPAATLCVTCEKKRERAKGKHSNS